MIVGRRCARAGFGEDFLQTVEGPAYRAHPHSGAVPEAVIRGELLGIEPLNKPSSVARRRIGAPEAPKLVGVVPAAQESGGYRDRQHGIVGISGPRQEEGKALALLLNRLPTGAANIPDYGAQHRIISPR
jgi:hypothetical protein